MDQWIQEHFTAKLLISSLVYILWVAQMFELKGRLGLYYQAFFGFLVTRNQHTLACRRWNPHSSAGRFSRCSRNQMGPRPLPASNPSVCAGKNHDFYIESLWRLGRSSSCWCSSGTSCRKTRNWRRDMARLTDGLMVHHCIHKLVQMLGLSI